MRSAVGAFCMFWRAERRFFLGFLWVDDWGAAEAAEDELACCA
jgi:hypothetical protein